jgi:cytochrome c oxidase subunit 2
LVFAGVILLQPGRAETKMPVIVVRARRFAFVPAQITLRVGQPVRLVFVSDDVTHSITIPGLAIDMPIRRGHPAETILTPSKRGDFPGKCTHYCGAGHDRMKFVVHVK